MKDATDVPTGRAKRETLAARACVATRLVLACILLACTARAEDLGERIDRFVQPKADAGRFNGVVLLGRADRIVYQHAFGYADIGSEEPLATAHRFNIGSIGKEFTGSAIALLVRSGKLRYQDTLGQHVSGLPHWANQISLDHLLTYGSGLPQIPAGVSWSATLTDEAILGRLREVKTLEAEPGTKYVYSVYPPFLLSRVIEQASGRSLEKFLREALFAPAGMTHTELEQQMTIDAPLRSKAFDASGNRDYFPLRVTLPLVYTNAADLFSWARALQKGDLLEEQEISRLATPLAERFDMHGYTQQQTIFGNVKRENGEVVAIKHQGGHNHFNSLLFVDRKSDVTVVVLTNHAADDELYRVADEVYALAMEPATSDAGPPSRP